MYQLKAFEHDEAAESAVRERAKEAVKSNAKPTTGHQSNYSKKRAWLNSNGVDFGYQVTEPKPWK